MLESDTISYNGCLPFKTQSLSGCDLSPWIHIAGHLKAKTTTEYHVNKKPHTSTKCCARASVTRNSKWSTQTMQKKWTIINCSPNQRKSESRSKDLPISTHPSCKFISSSLCLSENKRFVFCLTHDFLQELDEPGKCAKMCGYLHERLGEV